MFYLHAISLQETTTGETKVIERFDCSGCGDVDTSTVISKITDGYITGLTGRKLSVSHRPFSFTTAGSQQENLCKYWLGTHHIIPAKYI